VTWPADTQISFRVAFARRFYYKFAAPLTIRPRISNRISTTASSHSTLDFPRSPVFTKNLQISS